MSFVLPGKACLSCLLAFTLYLKVKHPQQASGTALDFAVSLLWLWVL
jgi:hypothetical protein